VEHINQLLLNSFADHQTDTRTPLRFSLVGREAADFDLHSPQANEFYALLRRAQDGGGPDLRDFRTGLYRGSRAR